MCVLVRNCVFIQYVQGNMNASEERRARDMQIIEYLCCDANFWQAPKTSTFARVYRARVAKSHSPAYASGDIVSAWLVATYIKASVQADFLFYLSFSVCKALFGQNA